MNSVLHERIARIARDILRERFVSIEDEADAMAAAIITGLGPDLDDLTWNPIAGGD